MRTHRPGSSDSLPFEGGTLVDYVLGGTPSTNGALCTFVVKLGGGWGLGNGATFRRFEKLEHHFYRDFESGTDA